MTTLQYRIYTGIAFVAVFLSVPLTFVLPVEWSFENGFIENAQVIILIVGAILILNIHSSMKWFQRFFAAGLVLIALRELSWGRVFFPVAMEELGPVFISMAEYKYRVPVYIFLTVYILAMIFMLIYLVPLRKIFQYNQPFAIFAAIIIAAILSLIGDHGWLIGKEHGQILEELNELIIYVNLPVSALHYCGNAV